MNSKHSSRNWWFCLSINCINLVIDSIDRLTNHINRLSNGILRLINSAAAPTPQSEGWGTNGRYPTALPRISQTTLCGLNIMQPQRFPILIFPIRRRCSLWFLNDNQRQMDQPSCEWKRMMHRTETNLSNEQHIYERVDPVELLSGELPRNTVGLGFC